MGTSTDWDGDLEVVVVAVVAAACTPQVPGVSLGCHDSLGGARLCWRVPHGEAAVGCRGQASGHAACAMALPSIMPLACLQSRFFGRLRVSTLTCPPTRAPYDPGDVTTCALSVAYGLGATRRRPGVCSAFTSLSFPCSDQIVKLAVHA